jgi:hypothetical protein
MLELLVLRTWGVARQYLAIATRRPGLVAWLPNRPAEHFHVSLPMLAYSMYQPCRDFQFQLLHFCTAKHLQGFYGHKPTRNGVIHGKRRRCLQQSSGR